MDQLQPITSEAQRRQVLVQCIGSLEVSHRTLNALLPGNVALQTEDSLWDYKHSHPQWDDLHLADKGKKDLVEIQIADLIKDVVAFHNSYGGFIVFGIENKNREIVGISGHLDTDDLKRKIKSYVDASIDISYHVFPIHVRGHALKIGMLGISKRPYNSHPLQFVKAGPLKSNGKRTFERDSIYLRREFESRPASSKIDDMVFLIQSGARELFPINQIEGRTYLNNNLPPRDPGLIKFIGRNEYLRELWEWLLDVHNPLKILVGLGGVGKTAIAREFAEQIIASSPATSEKLIWLSAKRKFFASIQNKYLEASRVDYSDPLTLLKGLLLELSFSYEQVNAIDNLRDCESMLIDTLQLLPAIIITDDIDSLETEQQHEVFHSLNRIALSASRNGQYPVKILITSRLDIGVIPAYTVSIKGLEKTDFKELANVTAKHLGLPASQFTPENVEALYNVTQGSPTFMNSIIRLVSLGDTLTASIARWKGSDGDTIRNFTFERELKSLGLTTSKVLYTSCVLDEPTLSAISNTTGLTTTAVRDAIADLRKYHLISQTEKTNKEYTVLLVPDNIKLMASVISDVFKEDLRKIDRAAVDINKEVRRISVSQDIGHVVSEIAALWRSNQCTKALDIAMSALKKQETNPILISLVGRSLLKIIPPKLDDADKYLQKAYEKGVNRKEHLLDWIKVKIQKKDWKGLLGVAEKIKPDLVHSEYVYYVALARAQLAEDERLQGRILDAAKKFRDAGAYIAQGLKEGNMYGRGLELISLKETCFINHVYLLDQLYKSDSDANLVWGGVYDAVKNRVIKKDINRLGFSKLATWFRYLEDLEFREDILDKMHLNIKRVNELIELSFVPEQARADMRQMRHLLEDIATRYEKAADE